MKDMIVIESPERLNTKEGVGYIRRVLMFQCGYKMKSWFQFLHSESKKVSLLD